MRVVNGQNKMNSIINNLNKLERNFTKNINRRNEELKKNHSLKGFKNLKFKKLSYCNNSENFIL